MDSRQLIGLDIATATQLLQQYNITNYEVVDFRDRKQKHFDKEIVVRATVTSGVYKLIVCHIQVAVLGEHA